MSESGSERGRRELVERIQQGDRAAFDALVRSHYAGLCSYVSRVVGLHAVAEEIVQDVLFAVWVGRRDLDAGRNIVAYLYTAAHNRARSHLKHRRVVDRWLERVGVAADPGRSFVEEEVEYRELADAVRTAVDQLPERCRMVFSLSRQSGLSHAEIADVMGISTKTVEAQMGKALRFLRERLASFIAEP